MPEVSPQAAEPTLGAVEPTRSQIDHGGETTDNLTYYRFGPITFARTPGIDGRDRSSMELVEQMPAISSAGRIGLDLAKGAFAHTDGSDFEGDLVVQIAAAYRLMPLATAGSHA